MKHWHLAIALICLGSTVASSQSVTVPTPQGPLDLSYAVSQLHPCYLFDQHRSNLAGAYIPAIQLHTANGDEIASLNAGLVWETGTGIGGPLLALGVRFDNIIKRAAGNTWWSQHVAVANLPDVEVGPFGGYINRLGWLYGAFVSKKLGK